MNIDAQIDAAIAASIDQTDLETMVRIQRAEDEAIYFVRDVVMGRVDDYLRGTGIAELITHQSNGQLRAGGFRIKIEQRHFTLVITSDGAFDGIFHEHNGQLAEESPYLAAFVLETDKNQIRKILNRALYNRQIGHVLEFGVDDVRDDAVMNVWLSWRVYDYVERRKRIHHQMIDEINRALDGEAR
jgi:hypothetical protein